MTNKKKIREQFRNEVYKRDRYTCRFCGTKREEKDLDAHHITDRNEMTGGGYVKENGITLCKYAANGSEENSCHMKAELFHISGGELWEPGMHPDDLYQLIGSSKELAMQSSERLK